MRHQRHKTLTEAAEWISRGADMFSEDGGTDPEQSLFILGPDGINLVPLCTAQQLRELAAMLVPPPIGREEA